MAMICVGVEAMFFALWEPTDAKVVQYRVYEYANADSGVCGRVEYRYQVKDKEYLSDKISPIVNWCETSAFWEAVQVALKGGRLAVFFFPPHPELSSISRFPGPLSLILAYGLLAFDGLAIFFWLLAKAVAKGQVDFRDAGHRCQGQRRLRFDG